MLPTHRVGTEHRAASGPLTFGRRSRDCRIGRPPRSREKPSHVWYLWQNWNRQGPIEAAATSSRFAIIGAGRLGASLALALCDRGLTLLGFTARTVEGRVRAEQWLGSPAVSRVEALVDLGADLYFVCVPDGAIADAAAEVGAALARRGRTASPAGGSERPPVVAHTSGATSVSVLAPCEAAGAATLVFHPLQTFPEPVTGASRFTGAGVALTPGPGRADVAGEAGMAVADLLGMRSFLLADDKRSLYHAAASVACNYLVTLEHVANEMFVRAGVPERVTFELFLPLVRATLDNLASRGPVAALTGPLSRGDEGTIAAHLQALAVDYPEAVSLYCDLGRATLELVAARNDVQPAVLDRMRELLAVPAFAPAPLSPTAPLLATE